MSARSLVVPPERRQNLTLAPTQRCYISQQEAAAQLHCDPDTIARRRKQGWFPHALDRRRGSLYPWCCLLRLGEAHEKELILPTVRTGEAA